MAGIDAIGNVQVEENVEVTSSADDQADADWEAAMEQKDVVTDQLFGLRISTPARARGNVSTPLDQFAGQLVPAAVPAGSNHGGLVAIDVVDY